MEERLPDPDLEIGADEDDTQQSRRLIESLRDSDMIQLRPRKGEEAANADNTAFPAGSQLCKKCNVQAMVLMDGCMTCLNCGESKCG